MKMTWLFVAIFLLLILGYPIMVGYGVSTGYVHRVMNSCPECTIETLEEKKAILKAEHDKQIAENMKKLHDGTYKPRPWAGFPWNREE